MINYNFGGCVTNPLLTLETVLAKGIHEGWVGEVGSDEVETAGRGQTAGKGRGDGAGSWCHDRRRRGKRSRSDRVGDR